MDIKEWLVARLTVVGMVLFLFGVISILMDIAQKVTPPDVLEWYHRLPIGLKLWVWALMAYVSILILEVMALTVNAVKQILKNLQDRSGGGEQI